jgi:hypothetical protein
MRKGEPDLFWRIVVLAYFAAIGTFFLTLMLRGIARNVRRDLVRWRETRLALRAGGAAK